jgi:hypothetical protein
MAIAVSMIAKKKSAFTIQFKQSAYRPSSPFCASLMHEDRFRTADPQRSLCTMPVRSEGHVSERALF